MHHVEIDEGSGFCFGVTTAIRKAEEELAKGEPLYCLGDIVHNGQECERLKQLGLITINHDEFARLKNAKVLLRAHGEPPQTYETARLNNIEIIDATCPVVLRLQKRIKQEFDSTPADTEKQIVIYGKNGHAEVLGLVGQTNGKAIVIEKLEEVTRLDFTKDIRLYSQTTTSLDEFRQIVSYIEAHIAARGPTACPTSGNSPLPTTWCSLSADTRAPTERYFSRNAARSTRIRGRLTVRKKSTRNCFARHGPSVSAEPRPLRSG